MSAATTVRVPASCANLGPGFDTLGVALEIYLQCQFQPAGELKITAHGRDAALIPLDDSNLIWRTALKVAEFEGLRLPPAAITISNEIPVGKGLGSSAAALVAGVTIAETLLELDWGRQRILDAAARLEGHPDNVAACVMGSIVTATIGADGVTRVVRLDLPEDFRIAVVCPDFALPTNQMRSLLPDCYSKEDTVFNLQRATLLVAALATGNREAFPDALEDRLHQPYRLASVPGLGDVLKLRAPGLLGCALSGAGPAVLVFFERGSEAVVEQVRHEFQRSGHSSEVILARIDRQGLRIV